jgi:hypothetical protein
MGRGVVTSAWTRWLSHQCLLYTCLLYTQVAEQPGLPCPIHVDGWPRLLANRGLQEASTGAWRCHAGVAEMVGIPIPLANAGCPAIWGILPRDRLSLHPVLR